MKIKSKAYILTNGKKCLCFSREWGALYIGDIKKYPLETVIYRNRDMAREGKRNWPLPIVEVKLSIISIKEIT